MAYEKPSRKTIASAGNVYASVFSSTNTPLAYMPALAVSAGISTYSKALRVWLSMLGAIARTLPMIFCPSGSIKSAFIPMRILLISADVNSARHSKRPLRTNLNSSCPTAATEPTVAVRDEITPSSGALTVVCFSLIFCKLSVA